MKKVIILFLYIFSISGYTQNTINLSKQTPYLIKDKTSVNNSELQGNFVFDTGSNITILDQSIIKKLLLPTTPTTKNTHTYYGHKELKKVFINYLKIGDFCLEDTEVYVTDLSFLPAASHIIGVIGLDIIQKFNWRFDFLNNTLSFSENPFNTDDFTSIPITMKSATHSFWSKSKFPFVKLTFNKKEFVCLLDTGYGGTISLKKYQENWVIGENIAYYPHPELEKILQLDFQGNIVKAQGSKVIDQSVGIGFLRKFDEVIISKNTSSIHLRNTFNTEPMYSFGFSMEMKDNDFVVVSLYKNSPAEQQGLKLNDKVLKINNTTLSPSTFSIIADAFEKDTMRVTKIDNTEVLLVRKE